jgi:voltage-gated potassium channel
MSDPSPGLDRRETWARARRAALRVVLVLTGLFAAYYLLPTRGGGRDVPWLLLALCLFAVVVGSQVPVIVRSRTPILRALEALAVAVPAFLLIFARSYLSLSLHDPQTFSEPLDRTGSLYFTVSCFATVGFGDIVPLKDAVRLMVSVQILLDLVVLGAVVRLFASAARRGLSGRQPGPVPH